MKKLSLFIVLFFPCLMFGQGDDLISDIPRESGLKLYRWEIGVNGGVNITNVTGLIPDSSGAAVNNNIGRLYGVTVVYHLNKVFAFKTDFDVEEKGWTVTNFGLVENPLTGISSVEDVTQNLNYFDIPAFLHIGFGNKFKFDFNFGPYVAFLLDNSTFITDGSGTEIPVDIPGFSGYSATDFGLTYGAGIDLALGKRFSFGFDLLYEHGLKDIKEDGLRNTSIDFDFGINFLFGQKK